jgi:4-carboxymuconolactone decarboxylase
MDESERHRRGQSVRKAILGEAHVARSARGRSAFNREFQDLLVRYAWGEIWTRPGLPPDVRRLVTIAFLVALGRHEELAMHVRAAREGGLSPGLVKEVLLQSAVYCGLPAANAAFRVAEEALAAGAPRRRQRPRKRRARL